MSRDRAPPLPPRPLAVAGWVALGAALPVLAAAEGRPPAPPEPAGMPPRAAAAEFPDASGRFARLADALADLDAGDAARRAAAREAARRAAEDPDPAERLAAAWALEVRGATAGRPVLRALAGDPDPAVAAAARRALLRRAR